MLITSLLRNSFFFFNLSLRSHCNGKRSIFVSLACFMTFCCFTGLLVPPCIHVTLMSNPLVCMRMFLETFTSGGKPTCSGHSASPGLKMQTEERGRGRAKHQHPSCCSILRDMGVPALGVCYRGLCHAFPP